MDTLLYPIASGLATLVSLNYAIWVVTVSETLPSTDDAESGSSEMLQEWILACHTGSHMHHEYGIRDRCWYTNNSLIYDGYQHYILLQITHKIDKILLY